MLLPDHYPDDRASGQYLRMHRFCREPASRYRCSLVGFAGEECPEVDDGRELPVEDRPSLPGHTRARQSPLRQLRWSNAHLLRPTY